MTALSSEQDDVAGLIILFLKIFITVQTFQISVSLSRLLQKLLNDSFLAKISVRLALACDL